MMDDVIRNKVMMLIDFSMEADIGELRKWSAMVRALVFAVVYLADSIQASVSRVPDAEEEER